MRGRGGGRGERQKKKAGAGPREQLATSDEGVGGFRWGGVEIQEGGTTRRRKAGSRGKFRVGPLGSQDRAFGTPCMGRTVLGRGEKGREDEAEIEEKGFRKKATSGRGRRPRPKVGRTLRCG